MFPVYILDDKTTLPQTGTFYVVARDGLYLAKDTGLVRALIKVEGISILKELGVRAQLLIPKIPSKIMAQTLLFFRRVYEIHKAEAAVLLYYSREKNEFMVDAPNQEVGAASVDYELGAKFSELGFQVVGTIHSHCNFSAFHSGTDKHDEENFDGIHITIGRVDQPYFTTASSIVVNNNRFPINIEQVVLGVTKVDFEPPSFFTGYKRRLGIQRDWPFDNSPEEQSWLDSLLSRAQSRKTQFYDILLPEGMDYRNFPCPREWLDRVQKKYHYGIKRPLPDFLKNDAAAQVAEQPPSEAAQS